MTDEQRLTHLLDRARRGALLPAEGEQLAVLVGELEKSAAINAEVDAQADEQLNGAREVAQYYKAVAEQAQAWGEQHRDRANRYRARTDAVRAELNAMRRDMGSSEDDGMSTAVSRIRAALQSVSHETPVPDDPRVTELEAAVARLRNFRNRWAAHAGRLIGRAVTAEARVTELEAEVARVRQALIDADWGGPDRDDVITEIRAALDAPPATA
ncbi:hypothetical protein ACIGNW_00150 [Streptomyces sp. NPDC053707]|uniref:hypothetical protein n=1 Tax=Streptomyces sp. NPDC053707 TaxID=3365712 RepID=UPI0037D47171